MYVGQVYIGLISIYIFLLFSYFYPPCINIIPSFSIQGRAQKAHSRVYQLDIERRRKLMCDQLVFQAPEALAIYQV